MVQFVFDVIYRLNVLQLRLPPLRERGDDIALLARHFLHALQPSMHLADRALDLLVRHAWPGNVRELQNVMARLAATSRVQTIVAEAVRPLLGDVPAGGRGLRRDPGDEIAQALAKTHGRVAEAAEMLGISRSTLWRRIRRLEVA